MTQSAPGFWLVLSVWIAGCGVQQETPAKEKNVPEIKPVQVDAEVNHSEKKVLDKLQADISECFRTKDWPAAERAIREGLNKTEGRPGLEITNAHFLMFRGDAALELGNEPDARRYFTDAMAVFHVHRNEEGRFEAFTALGRLEARRGDYAAAERQFEQAEALKEKLANRSLEGKFLIEKGRLASRQMKGTEASGFFQEALTIFDTAKDKQSMAEVLVLLAQEDDMLDRLSAARRGLERAAVLFDEIKDMDGKARAIHRLATFAEREKQTAKAVRLYGEAAALYESLGRRSAAANVERHLSTLKSADEDSPKK
jgi:tetratricopeptide (TPR) repeat protein